MNYYEYELSSFMSCSFFFVLGSANYGGAAEFVNSNVCSQVQREYVLKDEHDTSITLMTICALIRLMKLLFMFTSFAVESFTCAHF